MHRKRKWPKIDLYKKGGPSDIKTLSDRDLDRLASKAAANGWSAEGRPEWFREHRAQFRGAMLTIFGPDGPTVYRCIATVILADGSGGRFTLDVSMSDYDALEDLDERATVIMAHRYLATFSLVGLDAAQAATWDNSVWKKWGES